MKIAIIGTGCVGLVTGACFAEIGLQVTCLDVDKKKIRQLQNGIVPIYEPGLKELINRNTQTKRLRFINSWADCPSEVKIIFITVGTPPEKNGNANLQHILEVAHFIGKSISHYALVVTKSTVPIGTSHKIKKIIQKELEKRKTKFSFDVASNPEFLREGTAVKDFMFPDRVVVGIENPKAKEWMNKLYKPFIFNCYRMIYTDILSAEMIKYASNAMLATRISFMNEIANLCSLVGANINIVRNGIGSDTRIGSEFLYPGCGYGGSCFPKDIRALIKTASQKGYVMPLLQAVEATNNKQKTVLFDKLSNLFKKKLKNKIIAVWGLAFKPNTDDMREAPSLIIINLLLQAEAVVQVYDPVTIAKARRIFGNKLYYYKNMYDAVQYADALLLLTEWKEFRMPSWKLLKEKMNRPILLDGRNIYDKKELQSNGFLYIHI